MGGSNQGNSNKMRSPYGTKHSCFCYQVFKELPSCLSKATFFYLLFTAAQQSLTGTQLGLTPRLLPPCRQIQCYSLKPKSKERWQQARDKEDTQAAILNVIVAIQRSYFSPSTGWWLSSTGTRWNHKQVTAFLQRSHLFLHFNMKSSNKKERNQLSIQKRLVRNHKCRACLLSTFDSVHTNPALTPAAAATSLVVRNICHRHFRMLQKHWRATGDQLNSLIPKQQHIEMQERQVITSNGSMQCTSFIKIDLPIKINPEVQLGFHLVCIWSSASTGDNKMTRWRQQKTWY